LKTSGITTNTIPSPWSDSPQIVNTVVKIIIPTNIAHRVSKTTTLVAVLGKRLPVCFDRYPPSVTIIPIPKDNEKNDCPTAAKYKEGLVKALQSGTNRNANPSAAPSNVIP